MTENGKAPRKESGLKLDIEVLNNLAKEGFTIGQELLGSMVERDVGLGPISSQIIELKNLEGNNEIDSTLRKGAVMHFSGSFEGASYLLIDGENIDEMVEIITSEASGFDDWNDIVNDLLNEMGNLVLNGVCGTVANELKGRLQYTVPAPVTGGLDTLVKNNFKTPNNFCFLANSSFDIIDTGWRGIMAISFYFKDSLHKNTSK